MIFHTITYFSGENIQNKQQLNCSFYQINTLSQFLQIISLILAKLYDFKFAPLPRLILFSKSQLSVAVISFDPSSGNISYNLYLTPGNLKVVVKSSFPPKKSVPFWLNILRVIILVESQTAGFGGLLLWWNELPIFTQFFPQYSTHMEKFTIFNTFGKINNIQHIWEN